MEKRSLTDLLAAGRATGDFKRAISIPEALLTVHDEGPARKQPPARAMALNRATVVLTVAAWQAWVEGFARARLRFGTVLPKDTGDDWRMRRLATANAAMRPLVEREIKRFSTPSSGAVCDLLRLVNFDPRVHWEFVVGNRRLRQQEVAERLDAWLKVRHAIAHGDSHLPPVDVLAKTKGGYGSLTRSKAEQCVRFFSALVIATGGSDYREWA